MGIREREGGGWEGPSRDSDGDRDIREINRYGVI